MITSSVILILFLTFCAGSYRDPSKATIKAITGSRTLKASTFQKYECIAEGTPVPTSTWRFKGQAIQTYFDSFSITYETRGNKLISKLQLLSNKGPDEGDLKCFVHNSFGQDVKSLRLRIQGAQRGAKITAITGPRTLKASKMEKYECIAEGTPAPTSTWRFKNQAIQSYFDSFSITYETRGNKLISKLQLLSNKGPDEGDLKCLVHNSFGQDTKSLRLRIQGTQQDTRSNFKAKIESIKGPGTLAASKMEKYECIAHGNPVPTATWRFKGQSVQNYFDGFRISYATRGNKLISTLQILSKKGPDVGDLKCLVQNRYGWDEKTLRVRIRGKSTTTRAAKIKKIDGPEKLKLSEWGRYECIASGVPRPSATWSFNGQRIQDFFRYFRISYEVRGNTLISKLQLMSKKAVEEGNLKCSIYNSFGRDTKTKRVSFVGGDCVDRNQRCSSWAQRGECHKNPVWMKANCCKSCKGAKQDSPRSDVKRIKTIKGTSLGISASRIEKIDGPGRLKTSQWGRYECIAKGLPAPSSTWHFNGRRIQDAFQNFRISYKSRGNTLISTLQLMSKTPIKEGNLKCSVHNNFGTDTKITRLSIEGMKTVKSSVLMRAAKIEKIDGPENLKLSQWGRYECTAKGLPAPSSTWHFNGQRIQDAFQSFRISYKSRGNTLISTLQVMSKTPIKEGDLKCSVHNTFGTDTKSTTLSIGGGQEDTRSSDMSKTMTMTKSRMRAAKIQRIDGPDKLGLSEWGRYECIANGLPGPSSTWYFNGQRIQDSFQYFRISYEVRGNTLISKLQLMSKTVVEKGALKCSVQNTFGSDTKTKSLSIGG